MSQGVDIGTFSGNETLTWDCSQFTFARVTVFLHSGVFAGGTVTFRAGGKGTTEVLKNTSKVSNNHSNMIATGIGNFTFDLICDEMQFVMSGAGSPTVSVRVYPEWIR